MDGKDEDALTCGRVSTDFPSSDYVNGISKKCQVLGTSTYQVMKALMCFLAFIR